MDHAGVGRNTFYYHFEDKYDLVNWYFQSGVTQFLVERSAYASWNALLEAVEVYLLENKVFYCNALAYTGQNSLQQYIFDYLSSIFMQRAKELRPGIGTDRKPVGGPFFCRCPDGHFAAVGAGRHEDQHDPSIPGSAAALCR